MSAAAVPPIATRAAEAAAATTVAATTAAADAAYPVATAAAPLSAAAMESVKRRGLQLSEYVSAFARKDSPGVVIPLELKLLLGLILLFLFLLFLILVLWDRYGKEIAELYTPNGVGGEVNEVNPNDVADEYTVYQKLPTFFYEYMPKKKN